MDDGPSFSIVMIVTGACELWIFSALIDLGNLSISVIRYRPACSKTIEWGCRLKVSEFPIKTLKALIFRRIYLKR